MGARILTLAALFSLPPIVSAMPPVASYIFPAGGQRGTTVPVRVGGLFLHQECGFEMLGAGISAPRKLLSTRTLWFEGPLLPLPDSQRAEDYPQDMAGTLTIAPDAVTGVRHWRLWTSQGATPSLKFVVGELPEIVEDEIDGDPIPVLTKLPVTINGRIFPREDIDIWTFAARKGQTIRCEVQAAQLGAPLDARLEVRDPQGMRIAESNDSGGPDPSLAFTAANDGIYQVRIADVQNHGSQAHVYRLTLHSLPHVERVYPLGGRAGGALQLHVSGQNVPAQLSLALPAAKQEAFAHRFPHASTLTNPVALDVDELPEYLEESDRNGKTLTPPAVLNGRIAQPGEVDVWTCQGKKGDLWELDLRAASFGSRLDGVLTIADASDKQLARAEAGTQLEASLRFQVPADGSYRVAVQDRFRSRGGAAFAYRLRIAPPAAADFRLSFPSDAVTVPRKGQAKLKVQLERRGDFKDAVALTVQGLPKDVAVSGTQIAANQTVIELTFKAEDAARIDAAQLTLFGTAKLAGAEVQRTAQLAGSSLTTVLLAVALPTPFTIKGEYDMGFAARGSLHKRQYKIERNGYDGPLTVSLADRQARHLQGVTGPTIVVPAGASEFAYTAYLPPWMETGRTSRTCVMGVGVIKDSEGREHRVTYSSVNQNEQLVAVVGPGQLALEAERSAFALAPGKKLSIGVQIKRGQGIRGPVTLELVVPAHMQGVSAARATIAAEGERGELVVQCGETLCGPFTMPVVLRATLMHEGAPLVAEVKLDMQP